MSKPNLDDIRARDKRGALGLSLLKIADEGLLDRKALLAYVEQLESDLDAAAYRAGVAQGRIGQLQTQIEQLENLLDEVRALVGSDNESGMISADAIFHTIGTGNQGDRR